MASGELESGRIGNIGERLVTAWLVSEGYTCNRNTQLPGSTDIDARWMGVGGKLVRGLLVQVKTGTTPNPAPQMTADERSKIIARANRMGFEALCARVQINNRGEQVGQTQWYKLN